MKLIVIHGEDVERSRARLQKFIDVAAARKWNIVKVNAEKESLVESIKLSDLFGQTRFFILENPLRLNKNEPKWLKENAELIDETLVVYHKKVLSKIFLNSLPKIDKTELFDLPKAIWKFLDSFYPGNAKQSLTLYHQSVENEAAEFVFAMLVRQIRDLYHAHKDPSSMKAPDWRISKLQSQASRFPEGVLKEIISQLGNIDIKSKTSKASLSDSLDFLIATKLK